LVIWKFEFEIYLGFEIWYLEFEVKKPNGFEKVSLKF